MIKLTRLDNTNIFVNERNIQWIESLPDLTITFIGGARLIVKEKIEDVIKLIDDSLTHQNSLLHSPFSNTTTSDSSSFDL